MEIDLLHIDNADQIQLLQGHSRVSPQNQVCQTRLSPRPLRSLWLDRAHATGTPIVVTSHGSDTLGHEGWLLRRLHPLVDAMTITSKQNQDRVGLRDTFLLPCGVNTQVFKPREQYEAKRQLGWDTDRKVMLYVGRDSALKRLDILRDAHSIIKMHRNDVDLVLATAVDHDSVPVYLKRPMCCCLPPKPKAPP